MEGWLLDWTHLVVRWMHLVLGAAWIGASLYFNWLNNHVRPTKEPSGADRIEGDLFAVHGGAFYKVQKYEGAPAKLPDTLHWFKYEAYFTWITGFLLLVVIYWAQAKAFLIDRAVMDLSVPAAVALSAAVLAGGWITYDLLCKSPLAKKPALLSAVGFGLIAALAWGLTFVFSARAAYMHVGAVLGTIMAANVFFVIIPGQRAMVDAMIAGEEPDVERGKAGALRSLHNNYLTLPVLFVMVSNHFPKTYGAAQGWMLLVGLLIVGFLVRLWMNQRHFGKPSAWLLPAAAAALALIAASTFPMRSGPVVDEGERVKLSEVQVVVATRCLPCHSSEPSLMELTEAAKGIALESPEDLRQHAQTIHAQTIASKIMPLGNLTNMTEEERELLGRWIAQQGR